MVVRSVNCLPQFIHVNPLEHFELEENTCLHFALFEYLVGRVYSALLKVSKLRTQGQCHIAQSIGHLHSIKRLTVVTVYGCHAQLMAT
jgi:hypothetical protein